MAEKGRIAMIEKAVECPMCLNRLRNAKTLLCGHSFCHECLNKYIASRREPNVNHAEQHLCPLCRKDICMPNNCIKILPSNYSLKAVIDAFNSTATTVCEKHSNIETNYVCTECTVSLCSECAMLDHKNHVDKVMSLNEIRNRAKNLVARCKERKAECSRCVNSFNQTEATNTSKSKELLATVSADYLKKKRGLETKIQTCRKRLKNLRGSLQTLSEKKTTLTGDIVHRKESFNLQLNNSLAVIKGIRTQLSDACRTSENLLNSGRPCDLLELQIQLGTLEPGDTDLEEESRKERDMKVALENLKYEKGEDEQSLGELVEHRAGQIRADDSKEQEEEQLDERENELEYELEAEDDEGE